MTCSEMFLFVLGSSKMFLKVLMCSLIFLGRFEAF